MSSSSAATGLNRTRSLRQPTAGLPKPTARKEETAQKQAGKALDRDSVVSGAASAIPTSRLPATKSSLSSSTTITRSRPPISGASGSTTAATAPPVRSGATGTRSRPTSGIFGLERTSSLTARKSATRSAAANESEPLITARTRSTGLAKPTRPRSIASISQLTSTTGASVSPAATHGSPTSVASPIRNRLRSSTTSQPSTDVPFASTSAANAAISTSATGFRGTTTTKRTIGRANTVTTRSSQSRLHQPGSSSSSSFTTTTNNSTHAPPTSALATTTTITNTRPHRPASTDDGPRFRPAFTTLQQHYSPARNLAPKPLTSSYLVPPTPSKLPANIAISSETAKLQAELLQLHLLHREADAVAASWHASARRKLEQRFAVLVDAEAQVAREEAAAEESRNIAALRAWGSSGSGHGNDGGKGLEDKIQMLDGLLSGLWSLGEQGGRYMRLIRTFEKWVEQMTAAVEAREEAGGLGALMASDEVAFIGELDPAWHEEVSLLARKLDSWRRELAQLEHGLPDHDDGNTEVGQGGTAVDGHAPASSSLTRILAGCRNQVYDMLAELDVMERIEREAIAQEAAWIRQVNREDEDEVMDDTLRAGAIWRAF